MKLHKLLLAALLLLPCLAHAQWVTQTLPNAGATGTTVGALAKQTSGNAVTLLTTDTTAIGVVTSESATGSANVTTGNANIATVGQVYCLFPSAPVIDHFVLISSTNAGYCSDSGSTTYPTTGFVVGQVIGITAGPIPSTFPIRLILQQPGGGGGGGATIGSPISGGSPNTSLYVDNSGNLQNSQTLPLGLVTTQRTLTAVSNVFTPILSGANSSNQFVLTLAATNTIANATSPLVAQEFTIEIDQPTTGGTYNYTTSWGTGYTWPAGGPPTISTGAGAATLVSCHVTSTSTPKYQCYGPAITTASTGTISALTAPSSTTVFQMQGISGTDYGCTGCSFTPRTSGTVIVTIQATVNVTAGTINVGLGCQLSVGTGTAPTKNTALAGTQIGTLMEYTNPVAVTAADVNMPWSQTALVTGLVVGTTYWADEACESITTPSAASLTNVNVVITEK